jgi:hypothetical protein
MEINQHPAVWSVDQYPINFRRQENRLSHLTQQITIFSKKREPDRLAQKLGLKPELRNRTFFCLGNLSNDEQGTEQGDNQKGKQGKDKKEFALKSGTDV